MDEPPEQLYNQCIRDRMEFYKRVEPTEPPRDERLVLGDVSTPRVRFGLVDVSTALWSVILSNPEKSGLAAIHSVAKEAIPLGFVSQPCRMWESCDFFPPGLGCVSGGGREKGFSLLGSFFTTVFLSYSTRHGSLISSTMRPHALAAPRTGHLSHGSEKVAAADSWSP